MGTHTITTPAEYDLGIKAARLAFNKTQPATIKVPDPAFVPPAEDPTAKAPLIDVPNPALFATDAAYLQQRWGVDAAKSYHDTMQYAFRLPTGDWLQRWTTAEKKQLRDIGAGKVAGVLAADAAKVQGYLDMLDANPVVNLSDPNVTAGVPFACSLLEQTGIIPVGTAAARAAEVTALNL